MARVLIRFRDVQTMRVHDVGDEWDGPAERLQELARGGYVQSGPIAHDVPEDVSRAVSEDVGGITGDMTVAQLREVAKSRGVVVPKRATKAKLLEILEV